MQRLRSRATNRAAPVATAFPPFLRDRCSFPSPLNFSFLNCTPSLDAVVNQLPSRLSNNRICTIPPQLGALSSLTFLCVFPEARQSHRLQLPPCSFGALVDFILHFSCNVAPAQGFIEQCHRTIASGHWKSLEFGKLVSSDDCTLKHWHKLPGPVRGTVAARLCCSHLLSRGRTFLNSGLQPARP